MNRKDQFIITITTIFSISALYTPQPLLPILGETFHLSQPTAGLLITVTLLPLGFAPLGYGLLVGRISPKTMMLFSVVMLAGSEAAIALSHSFPGILGLRLVQGFLIPASLTALMTTISSASSDQTVGRSMALYISSTIVGGFFGRFASGVIASAFGWRASFWFMCAALAATALLLVPLGTGTRSEKLQPMRFSLVREVLARPVFVRVYFLIFCLFFVFASLLNFLPFRLQELSREAPALRTAFLYSGYLTGLIASLSSTRVAARIGGETRSIFLGFCLYLFTLFVFLIPEEAILYPAMFLFCGAMFFIHSVAPGILNVREREYKGVVNGLYIAFYYLGGTIGSYLPGLIYRHWGWTPFIWSLVAVLTAGVAVSGSLFKKSP